MSAQDGRNIVEAPEREPAAAPAEVGQDLELETVYRKHVQDVARWAGRFIGPGADVNDVVQEVFLVVRRKLPGFRAAGALKVWVYRITYHVCRDYSRARKSRVRLESEWQQASGHVDSVSPAQQLETRRSAERLYRVLDQLPERHRTVLILFELEELTGEEIAQLMDAKLATVWVWLHRAREAFQRKLVELEGGRAP